MLFSFFLELLNLAPQSNNVLIVILTSNNQIIQDTFSLTQTILHLISYYWKIAGTSSTLNRS